MREGVSLAAFSARLGAHVTLEARANGEIVACFQGYSVGLGTFSAGARPIARRNCEKVCRSPPSHPADGTSTRRLICSSRRLAKRGLLEYRLGASRERRGSGRHRTADSPIIGPKRRRSPTRTRSCCRGSPICAGAATRWFWNRRAPARCSKFAIRRSRPPWQCCPGRSKSNSCDGRTVFREWRFSLCCWIAKSCSRSKQMATKGLRPAEGDSDLVAVGISRSSVPRSQHGRPARQPAGRRLPLLWRDFAAAGGAAPLAGTENRSAANPGMASTTRRSRSSCGSGIRRAVSTTSGRSHSPSCRDFSTAPRASLSRMEKCGRSRRRRADGRLHGQAISFGGRGLRT